MDLFTFGWTEEFEEKFREFSEKGLLPARVLECNRLVYKLFSDKGELLGKLSGKFRHACLSTGDYPTVGDWVVFKPTEHKGFVSIQGMLERKSRFVRKAAGAVSDEQVIAANIDTIFIVSGLDRDFNMRRLERYVLLASESNAEFVFILNKADLCEDVGEVVAELKRLFGGVAVCPISALNDQGLEQLDEYIRPGKTVVFLGSSGVGKSTLINRLLGEERQKTGHVREHDGRGRHITTSKNILLLPSGGLVIDTPGMRELQVLSTGTGLNAAFADIEEIAEGCKYKKCRHVDEPGCAVLLAVSEGIISEKRLDNYHKLVREIEYNLSRYDARLQDKRKKFWKDISKQAKRIKKHREGSGDLY